MSDVTATNRVSPWPRVASFFLSPGAVLTGIWVTIIITASQQWAQALFWAVIALTATLTFIALAGAKPLRPVGERSHLLHRLSWLGRYGTAAAVLCASTFFGALAGSTADQPDVQSLVTTASGVVGFVAAWAARIGATVFFGWLVVDVIRMGKSRRKKGLRRAIRRAAGRRIAQLSKNGVVTGWLLALTSPAMVAVSLGAVTIYLIMSLQDVAR
ncbi:hypothetical protein [Parafrigoribacterium soli]|uniref:hypothetical protein n=1 Tax=Parafrigoribacterium soli TaxID=3144663 RepID=UPI0032EA97C4